MEDLPRRRITHDEGLAKLSSSGEKRFVTLLEHGSLSVELYAAIGADLLAAARARRGRTSSSRGPERFSNGETRHPFGPGDFLCVPAGVIHRFENFTNDLVVWVIFSGPEGGGKE